MCTAISLPLPLSASPSRPLSHTQRNILVPIFSLSFSFIKYKSYYMAKGWRCTAFIHFCHVAKNRTGFILCHGNNSSMRRNRINAHTLLTMLQIQFFFLSRLPMAGGMRMDHRHTLTEDGKHNHILFGRRRKL